MDANISTQDRFYRRGMVLGYTLAEIMVLIIFALLLAFSWHLAAKNEEINKLSQSLEEREASMATLTERARALEDLFASGDDFDDLFRELELARELQNVQKQAYATLREELEALQDESTAREDVVARLEQFDQMKEKMTAVGLDENQIEEFFANTLSELADAKRLADGHESQVRNLQRKLEGLGKGTEMPACWASRETGKTEYIFNVALTSSGIITRDNALSHRASEQARLPIQAMVFEKEIRPEQFLMMTESIFHWSEKEGCRFFVRIYDLTQDKEKNIYKQHLRTLGARFYSYEDLNGTFRTVDDRS